MTNSTDEFWDVNGVSLQTMAQNITSWGGEKQAPPPLRGEDVVIPYSPGALAQPRMPDARSIPLSGWILGIEDRSDGSWGVSAQGLRLRWRALRRLLWSRQPVQLTKRWLDDDSQLREATAQAQYEGGMEPVLTAGGTRAEWAVTYRLADPYFYSAEVAIPLVAGVPKVVEIDGDDASGRVFVDLVGPMTAARLQVLVGATVVCEMTYTALAAGGKVTIDVARFTALEVVGLTNTRAVHKVDHSGGPFWLHLPIETTQIKLLTTGSTGSATIRYSPAWF